MSPDSEDLRELGQYYSLRSDLYPSNNLKFYSYLIIFPLCNLLYLCGFFPCSISAQTWVITNFMNEPPLEFAAGSFSNYNFDRAKLKSESAFRIHGDSEFFFLMGS